MLNIKDLKDQLLIDKPNKFYVFYGEDYGLRKHYINKISESYQKTINIDSVDSIKGSKVGRGLIKSTQVYVIYNDIEFARSRKSVIETFINSINKEYTCVVLVYETELASSNLFKYFGNYITYFPRVNDNIAMEFVDSELSLNLESKEEMITNCENDYSTICLEADKIKNYAQVQNVSHQVAYDDLRNDNQLLNKYPPYRPDDLMDDVLQGNFSNLAYWSKVINECYQEDFWIMLNGIFTNYLIAYLIVDKGKYEGSTIAYQSGLPWYRTKIIREYKMPYEADYLLECANNICELDAKVKNGSLAIEQLFDYFLTVIV